MLTIRLSQSCCWFFDVARHTPINRTHCSAFPTLLGLGGPAGPSEAPPGIPEKYRKKRKKISTRRLLVPGIPLLVRKSTRLACIDLEKGALLDLLLADFCALVRRAIPQCLYPGHGIGVYDHVGRSRVWSTIPAVVDICHSTAIGKWLR